MNRRKALAIGLFKIIGIPSIPAIALVVWFYMFQERPYELANSVNGIGEEIFNSIIRTVSHLSKRHLFSNSVALLSIGVTVMIFSNLRFYIANLFSITVVNILLLTLSFDTAVGSSLLIFGFYVVSVMLFLSFQYKARKLERIDTGSRQFTLITILFASGLGAYLLPLFADVLIVLGVISVQEPSIFEFVVNDIENYTITSSRGHVSGAFTGLVSFVFWNAIFRIQSFDVLRLR